VEQHPDVWLDDRGWATLFEQIHEIANACGERGFEVAFHPHGGSYVEAPFEVDRLMEGIELELLGLCLDTGHSYFGGDDPLRLIEAHGEAITWVHLKDVDVDVMAELKREGLGLEEAWRRGVFCELGEGGVPIDDVLSRLQSAGYQSWIVVEQDRLLDGGTAELGRARGDADRNRRFLAERDL
jgi:inosose dehydratase